MNIITISPKSQHKHIVHNNKVKQEKEIKKTTQTLSEVLKLARLLLDFPKLGNNGGL